MWVRIVKIVLPLAILFFIPFVDPKGYLIYLTTTMLIFSILASSLNLLMGYTGLVSIGHGAFFGIGAYTSGILALRYGFSFWVAILMAMALAGLVALALGVPSFRTKGIQYIIVTIAFQFIASEIFDGWYKMTGGGLGLKGIPRPGPLSIPFVTTINFQSTFWFYYLVLSIATLVFLGIGRIIKSPLGLSLMAIRDNERKAIMMGIHPLPYKVFVFVFSCGLAGLAGSLYAHFMEFAHPDLYSFSISVDLFLMVMLGGSGTLYGPLFGVFVLELIREVLHEFVALRFLIYGFLLVGVIVLTPNGLLEPFLISIRRLTPKSLLSRT